MTGNRNKILQVVAVVIIAVILLLFLQGPAAFTLFTDFLTFPVIQLVVLVLLVAVGMQAIALYILARRPEVPALCTTTTMEADSEQRGRGRPRKPCSLALSGVLQCPLEPNLEIDPTFIAKVSIAVAELQHEKLVKPIEDIEKDTKVEPAPAAKAEEKPETKESVKDAAKKVADEEKEKAEGAKEKSEKESVGKLLLEMTEVLNKKPSKPEKKDDKK
jgi:hypothetical protein